MQKMATNSSSTIATTTTAASSSGNNNSATRRGSTSSSSSSSNVLFLSMFLAAAMLIEMAQADVCQCGPRCASYKHELHCSRCCTSVMKRRSVPFLNYPVEQLDELLQQQAAPQKLFDHVEQQPQQQLVELIQFDGIVVGRAVEEPQASSFANNGINIEKVPEAVANLDAQQYQAVQPRQHHHHRLGHLLRSRRHLHAVPQMTALLKQHDQQQLFALSPRRH